MGPFRPPARGLALRLERRPCTEAEAARALAGLQEREGLYFGVDAGVPGLHPLQATLVDLPALRLRVWDDGLEVQPLTAFGAAVLEKLRQGSMGDAAVTPAHAAVSLVHAALSRVDVSLSLVDASLSRVDASLSPRHAGLDPAPISGTSIGSDREPGDGLRGKPAMTGSVGEPALGGFLGEPAMTEVCRSEGTPAPLAQARALLAAFTPDPDILLLGALRFDAHRLASGAPRPADDDQPLGVLYLAERLYRRDAAGGWTQITLALEGVPSCAPLAPSPGAQPPHTAQPGDDHPPGGYASMVARALQVLRERPLVSLTLSQSYRRRVGMPASEAFARLRAANPAPASFFLHDGAGLHLLGASPDLQLVVRDRAIEALPVCGTVARRPGAQGEADAVRELFNEEVDAAALAVCSDALRNDLAPLCEPGSLRLTHRRRPMALATVVHAVDRIAGTLRADADAWDAVAATAAPVMLTGTPRAVAVQAIAELEASPRGWYGGMVVQVGSTGDALVGTILRAAAVRNGVAEVRTGGDLLADSSPAREEAESRLKTRSVWRAFGLEPTPGPAASVVATGAARAIRLRTDDDPFAAGLQDCLLGLGCAFDVAAAVTLIAGPQPLPSGPVVAIGDAAYRLLQASGIAIEPCAPEQGRPLACALTPESPVAAAGFTAGRYASYRLMGPASGWTSWAQDVDGVPVLLVRPGAACLLFRPDSLLADDTARALLLAAIDHVC